MRADRHATHSERQIIQRPGSVRRLALTALVAVGSVPLFGIWFRWFPAQIEPSESPGTGRINSQPVSRSESGSSPFGILGTSESRERRAADEATFDPAADGWVTESFASAAHKQLEAIAEFLPGANRITPEALQPYVSQAYSGLPLRPAKWVEILRDESAVIRRADSHPHVGPTMQVDAPSRGDLESFAADLQALADSLGGARNVQVHLKLFGVELSPTHVDTKVDFEVHGTIDGGTIQQNAIWTCRWTRPASGPPLLLSIEVTDFEEILGTAKQGTWFADCTSAVLERNPSFRDQLMFGLNHWLRRIERVHRLQIYARNGLAVGDANGDGFDDVYVCQPGGLPNRLFLRQPDGTASDWSSEAGVDWLDESRGALFVDLDNDADQDLAISCTAGILVMENDSTGRYELRLRLPVERSVESITAADYDHDGDLDLYACVYRADRAERDPGSTDSFLYHDANNGGTNRLYRNDLHDGDWRFTDVTRQIGLDEDNRRWSFTSSWEDYDSDGDQDLYVANDYGQNCLYRNDGGHFSNVAVETGVVDFGNSMSVSWGDFNRDGWMDLYVGNMFSSAGNRVTNQSRFMTRANESTRAIYRRFAKGNSLFANVEGRRFTEVGAEAAVEMGRWAWSSIFVDINNDGWEDLLVANGFITSDDPRDL